MSQTKVILCPTDLSAGADSALTYAAEFAIASGATLLVVYWHEAGPHDSPDEATIRPGPAGLFEESIALNVSPDILDSLIWEGLVVDGPSASEAIARAAAELGAQLIVMRSRRRPVRATFLGSTAGAVSRTAPCPVLVTHPDAGQSGRIRFRRILVAYDFWDDAEIALQHALAIATEHGAEVHLLHVIPPRDDDALELSSPPLFVERIAGRLRGAVPQMASLGVRVVPHIVIGKPYREILAFAEVHEIDLICMGARGRDFGARSLFGSNSDRVLRQARCPVLVTRPLKPSAKAPFDSASRVPDETAFRAQGGHLIDECRESR